MRPSPAGRARRRRALAAGWLALLCCLAAPAGAQNLLQNLLGGGSSSNSNSNVARPGEPTQAEGGPTVPNAVGQTPPPAAKEREPFGASLFTGINPPPSDAVNPNYVIQPGDRINVRLWGGTEADSTSVVDPEGNIFLPGNGVIHVAGVHAGDLQRTVETEARRTFTTNVQVYAVLLTTHRVGVYVTGFVQRPGRYSGSASDTVLDYLVRAGGVDPSRGSYRNITVTRGNRPLAHIDLYRFLLTGMMPQVDLQEGDTVFVAKQNALVAVDGAARNDFLFEIPDQQTTGNEIIELARPLPAATNAVVQGTRDNRPFSLYVTLAELKNTPVRDQDKITFVTDAAATTVRVRIEGSRIGPSVLVAGTDTRLPTLLNYVAVDPALADTKSVYVLRKSVADQQRRVIAEAMDRLERSLFLAISPTTGVSQIRASEAQLISSYIQRARQVVPEGRLVVADDDGKIADLRLEDDDVVVIPEKSQVVLVSGEVLAPQAIFFQPGMTISDYVKRAGGYSERGRNGHFMVRRANGEIFLDTDIVLRPGDELIILPYIDPKYFQLGSDFLTLLYQVALSAKVFGLF